MMWLRKKMKSLNRQSHKNRCLCWKHRKDNPASVRYYRGLKYFNHFLKRQTYKIDFYDRSGTKQVKQASVVNIVKITFPVKTLVPQMAVRLIWWHLYIYAFKKKDLRTLSVEIPKNI